MIQFDQMEGDAVELKDFDIGDSVKLPQIWEFGTIKVGLYQKLILYSILMLMNEKHQEGSNSVC